MKLLLCKYNNYYNRIIKTEPTYVFNKYKIIPNINFKLGDGVTTTQVVNWTEDFTPDYLVVTKDATDIPIPELPNPSVYYFEVEDQEIEDANPYITKTSDAFTLNLTKAINDHTTTYSGQYSIDFEVFKPASDIKITFEGSGSSTLEITGDGPTIQMSFSSELVIDKDFLISKGWTSTQEVSDITIYGSTSDHVGNIVFHRPEIEFEIESRWFIIDSVLNRKDQYEMTLRRDVIADNYYSVLSANTFIEKATLSPNNKLIFNKENMTYNQIKQKEVVINDKSATAWAVGYLANNRQAISGNFGYSLNADIDLSNINHTDWTYYQYVTNGFKTYEHLNEWRFATSWWHSSFWTWDNYFTTYTFKQTADSQSVAVKKTGGSTTGHILSKSECDKIKGVDEKYKWVDTSVIKSKFISDLGAVTDNEYSQIKSYAGKKILFADGMYECVVDQGGTTTDTKGYIIGTDSSATVEVIQYVHGIVKARLAALGITIPTTSEKQLNTYVQCTYRNHSLVLRKLDAQQDGTTNNWTIPVGANQLQDAPYTMFAIPYYINGEGAKYVIAKKTGSTVTSLLEFSSPDFTENWLENIIKQCGSNLYDLQVLPYCPIPNYYIQTSTAQDGSVRFIFEDLVENVDYSFLTNNNVNKGIIFYPKRSTLSFQITNLTRAKEINEYPTVDSFFPVTNVKVQSETQMCRLVSPNYSGAFEFNLAKNGGCKGFNVDITYKPYNPYIQIAPIFDGMYGEDFNDSRGLICTGDFSFPAVIDNWKEYEIQNKNYLNAFNRQIENMDVTNSVQREREVWSAVTGSIQGAASGAVTGAMTGGGIYGAVAGAAIGGTASAIGGARDVQLNDKLRSEALDYTKDQFGYQLGNIKALPYTLSKTSSLNAVSKYFPFVEVYDCTDDEKEALNNKLKYNGMTVMTIGKIGDYLQTDYSYIKGSLIRMEDTDNDFHELNAIADELYKGVFIK